MNGVKEEEDLCFCMLLLDWLYREREKFSAEKKNIFIASDVYR